MKNSKIVLAVLLMAIVGFTACSSDDNGKGSNVEQISEDQLPTNSKTFLRSVFPNASFRHTAKVTTPNYYGTEYTTSLDNKVEIDFDKAGNWTEVEMSDHSAIPTEFLKQEVSTILDYVNKNYPGMSILELDRDMKRGYEVTLSNGLELIFNIKQEFVGLDLDMDRDEVLIVASELPSTAQKFLKDTFAGAEVVLAKKELDREGDEYKVYLSNGVKVEFDKVGNWIEVEVKHTAIMPETVVPVNVMTYVKTHYSTYKIVSIEKERDTFQIELVKGNQEVELLFDKEGNFLRIE
ncbi:PepSY-like domain-containing protein [Myroides marinus]|uniref:PepSY-like domain-containing protein n=1 Tax=Myroides marinus TaxID=703342 RepID=UPI0007421922|nr:PepSY-like domain-containing protein [Myroides marinus]KUF43906.1 hypothetical protein AS361_04550 [Myroides marinus]MDM1346887.1 PepSY-like domain-containing protein [Myroides marinus]MDM1352429.1 PepSY-like domain-containing protein [Myroides marinus]MDM1356049.1 PepSY-like domain-containing protein [Myroides marinus]MDM1359634.1 PepSY-like domain-containing protein [Myroides marinus]